MHDSEDANRGRFQLATYCVATWREAPAADGFRANFAKLFLTDSFPLIPFISINDKQIYI